MTRREKVSFLSGAVSYAGYLFLPEPHAGTGERLPVVILAHGFSGTMDRLFPYAERFAADGIAALVFDYRGFGESGGAPRQVVDLPSQHEDLRAVVAWVRGRDDPRIVAVVAQIPSTASPGGSPHSLQT